MKWKLAGREFNSRLLLGSARYPSPECLRNAILRSRTEIVTVSLRRSGAGADGFWDVVRACEVAILPNTAGCRSAREAVLNTLTA